ncbi:MAG TPA: PilW family protein [Marinagarivorans sp.]
MLSRTSTGKLKHRIHAGFSLIEMMVTLLIAMVILSGVFQVLVASKRSELDHQEIVYIQENARFALDVLSRDIRMAGYFGCAQQTEQVNVIKQTIVGGIGTAGLRGYDGVGKVTSHIVYGENAKAGTDALMIQRGDDEHEYLVREQSPSTNTITVWQQHNFQVNQPLALVDGNCRFSALFTASQIDTPNTIVHAQSENNCSDILRGRYDCRDCRTNHCPRALPKTPYLSGSRIMPLISNAYFIGDSSLLEGAPALMRQSITVQQGRLTTRIEELATGVENIQFIYGVDTQNTGAINEYRSAVDMDINADGVIDSRDWQHVKAVKIDMLLVSKSPVFTEPRTVVFNGIEYPGLFMRQIVSTTVHIRNYGA